MNRQLRVDPEFRDKIPPLTEDEFKQLEQNILADGEIYEPIIVWNGTIVDGHNRYKIAQKHPEIPFKTREMNFPDKWAAFDWMYSKQLGRRNLTEELRTVLIGKMYEARKKTRGAADGFRGNQYAKVVSGQNGAIPKSETTRESVAKEVGIGARSVERAAQFAKGVDAIREVSPTAADKILSGTSGATKRSIQEFTQMEENDQKEFIKSIENGEKLETAKLKPKRNPNSDKGNTMEDRAVAKKVAEAVAGLSSDEGKHYTLEILLSELEVNGVEFVRLLRNAIDEHPELVTEWNAPVISETIQTIIDNITEVKESIK